MLKFLATAFFGLLLALTIFDSGQVQRTEQDERVELAQKGGGTGNAHGCPKGQVFQKHTKSCVPKSK
jgi:hypothetical protein